jgi:DsbC/DsbD-like thiol-disulfide interchange protein/cytochrome c biogenesis protein CcdA
MRRPLLALIAFSALCAPLLAGAQSPSSPIATAQLVVDAPLVKRGKAVSAGVTITLPEHWHIYWKNPGDSGIATSLEWALPDGITAGEIEWPAPERIEMQGLVNYGYSHVVTLPVYLTPTRDDVVGEVKVKASWLVCKDICIPESAELTAMLNGNADAAKIIAAARAQVPQPFTGNASFAAAPDAVTLTITRDNPWGADDVRFSPADDGIMANYPYGSFKQVGNELTLTMPRGSAEAPAQWQGVLHITKAGKEEAWDISAKNSGPVAETATVSASSPAEHTQTPAASTGFTTALLLAFLGGLILNIMPCVLPILALKALALSKKAAASRTAAAKQGFSYTAGVVASFMLIAAAMLALKATGSAIGWGFQLQNPAFVAFLTVVMLLVSANLLGLFELPTLFGAKATGVNEDKLSGSFLTGVLAVLVATPCTAPFMATAVGATLSLPTAQALAVFAALGLGMASPFLIISLWPAARRLLPKPGAWMHRFKQILAIPMLATAAWLVWVLVQILSPAPIVKTDLSEAYSAERLAQLRAEGKPVFVDATAAWCISCKVNERVALKPAEMQQFFRDKHITILIADWTNSDPEITKYLAQFNRNGVPLYVYYAPKAEPVVLPQVLTPSIVREAIEAAH